jgi:23S rRNA (adenine2503-C2)-methyltransferase
VVIDGLNDDEKEMEELVTFARKFPSKINLIEYNPIGLADYKPSKKSKLDRFADGLTARKLIVNVRRSRGKDIDAACGQLINKSLA